MKTNRLRLIIPLFLFLFVIGEEQAFSQTHLYQPFPEKYGKWLIKEDGPLGPGEVNHWNLTVYETAGDTVLNGITYKKVAATPELTNISPGPFDIWALNYGPKHLAFAYRNDTPNKKVYILTDLDGLINGNLKNEYLWYDFNIEAGDTVNSSYAIAWTKQNVDYKRITASKIDSVLVCGRYEKQIHFNCPEFINELVEGVGFADNFIKTYIACMFEPVYLNTTYFKCSPDELNDETHSSPFISVFPNPASQTLQLKWDKKQYTPDRYLITDCLGKVVLQNKMNELVDISSLKEGMYFITVTGKEETDFAKSKFLKQ